MKNTRMQQRIEHSLNAELSSLRTSERQREILLKNAMEGKKMKHIQFSAALILALILSLITVGALAAVLLTPKEVVEQVAVPMALQNDTDVREETYSPEELAQLIEALNENGISLEENDRIMAAFQAGKGYWEEEVIMEIGRQAFGGGFTTWSIEEKHWFEDMMVQIGFSEYNPYILPQESDMTVTEARAWAAKKLREEFGAELPTASNEDWRIEEWFFQFRDEEGNPEPARWQFEFINAHTGTGEYIVEFTRDGQVVDISEAGFHGDIAPEQVDSFSLAERLMGDKYGSMADWPLEAWLEFGQMIAHLTPERRSEWCYQHAGYRLPPKGHIGTGNAFLKARDALGMDGAEIKGTSSVFCCMDGERPIFKVCLSCFLPGSPDPALPDAVWCAEVDCMTGEVTGLRPYDRTRDSMLLQYVPFSVLDSAPAFEISPEEQARREAVQQRDQKFREYEAQYKTAWYFWPLEAQREALGPNHDLPQGNEMTREQAIETALNAVREKYGQAALDKLGNYHTGAILCRYQEDAGVRAAWEIYISSDPVLLTNGYRVNFDDPAGLQIQPAIEVSQANGENG